jgi:hypothetical protein
MGSIGKRKINKNEGRKFPIFSIARTTDALICLVGEHRQESAQ